MNFHSYALLNLYTINTLILGTIKVFILEVFRKSLMMSDVHISLGLSQLSKYLSLAIRAIDTIDNYRYNRVISAYFYGRKKRFKREIQEAS